MTDFLDVPDGLLALEYLRGRPPYNDRARFPFPTLLLLDLKMPGMNGLEALAWLATRQDMKNLPALVLTGLAQESDRQMAAKLGAREFLIKPSEPHDWIKLAQGLHHRWLARHDADGEEQSRHEMAIARDASVSLAMRDQHDVADAAVRGGLFG